MVEKLTLNSRATALMDIPAVSMPIVVLCCVTKLHILDWSFIVSTTAVKWMDYLGKE
jgi:hypothetical protein